MNNTESLQPSIDTPLAPHELAASTRAAAEAFIAAGTAANTVRSYQSALAYWSAWLRLRWPARARRRCLAAGGRSAIHR
jgi:hypothetical protein